MISNRSVPADTVLPHVAYADVTEAAAWLASAFGFSEHYRYGGPGGPVSGVQMHLGNAFVMLRKTENKTPAQLGFGTQSLTILVEDVEAHFKNAQSSGAEIVEQLHETAYGELQYGARDLAGHHWLFARHARDVSPEAWGATVSRPIKLSVRNDSRGNPL